MALQLELDVSLGDVVGVAVRGELDAATAPELTACVERLLAAGPADIEIELDLAEVAFIDSYGLFAVAALRDGAGVLGGHLALGNPSSPVRRLARLLHVDLGVDTTAVPA